MFGSGRVHLSAVTDSSSERDVLGQISEDSFSERDVLGEISEGRPLKTRCTGGDTRGTATHGMKRLRQVNIECVVCMDSRIGESQVKQKRVCTLRL